MEVIEICEKLFDEKNFEKYSEGFEVSLENLDLKLSRKESFLLEDFFRHESDHLLKSYITANFYELNKGLPGAVDPVDVLRRNPHLKWLCEIGVRLMWSQSTGEVILSPFDQYKFYGLVEFIDREYEGLLEYQKSWESSNLKFWEALFGRGFAKPKGINGKECLAGIKAKLRREE